MDYKFRDLVDIPKLQKLMDEFYNLTKIPHGLLDPDGNILTATGGQDICTKFHRINPNSELRCRESDLSIKDRLNLNQDYGFYVCRNGLIEGFTPIIVAGKHIATLFLGQFLHNKPDPEYFRSQAQEFGFNADACLDALERVPIIPEDKVESCMKYFARLAELLSYIGLNQLKQKEAEKSLLKINGDLETLVSQRTAELVTTNVELHNDILKRKQVEAALRKSEQRYRRLVEFSPNGIVVESEGKMVFANMIAEKLLGLTGPAELLGKSAMDFVHPDYLEIAVDRIRQELPAQNTLPPIETKIIRTDGKVIDVEARAIAINYQGKPAVQFVFQDITDRKKMEEELLKTSKLESVSVLAGGIAHDFNNILTILLGNVSLAKALVNSEDKIYQKLVQIENATLQAKDLTMQLLTFAKGGTPLKDIVAIGKIIKESASFALSGSNVRCEFFIPDDIWLLEIDVGQFTQVINNLVINADQAMRDGGIIKIRAENVTVGENHALPIKAGNYVEISIEDEGIGIPEENLQKIFDPYFTTKSGGSGLGLATSYSIIMKHGGYITLESKPGAGTTFYIYLPACVNKALSKNEESQTFSSGKGRILVMDDEAEIRQVLGEMLALLGYEADFAKDGEEAIELYKRANELGHPFAAVIMDLTIPGGMGGKEAIRRLHEDNPNVRAIVSSGYSDDPVMANFSEYGFTGFVAKPYCIEELGRVLQKVVMAASPEAGVPAWQ